MSNEDTITKAAQCITQGDFMGAMEIFEEHINSNRDDPAGYHGWAESALFEIQENGNFDEKELSNKTVSLSTVIWQIVAVDFVFSVDSILTAIGLTEVLLLMVIAVVISILFMIFYASKISDIIDRYPSLEILALCFLILIGFTLILEAAHIDIPKGFIYFSLFFTLGVELINIRFRRVSLKRIKIRK